MSFSTKQHQARYKRLRTRQPSTGWTPNYQAGIRATRAEAPAISRATRISRFNRFGRTLHAHSLPERTAIVLAMYWPSVFDLREQYVLSPKPSPHPLFGHPLAAGMELPELPGTVPIFDAIGELDRHPVLRYRDDAGQVVERPDLFVADLLLGIRDSDGPFCTHWSIKADELGHKLPMSAGALLRHPAKAQAKFDLRMRIDPLYFGAAGVPTREFAANEISDHLVVNLMDCFAKSIRPVMAECERAKVKALIRSTDLTSVSPHHLSLYCRQSLGVDLEDFRRIIYTMVWNRELRVDLFTRLLFDRPWPAERTDPLHVYSHLFAR